MKLNKLKHKKTWLVKLARGEDLKVNEVVEKCRVKINEMETHVNLSMLTFESYDIIVGMDWMEGHKVILNLLDKTFTYVDDNGSFHTIIGVPKNIYV